MELTSAINVALVAAGFPVVTVRYIGGSYVPEFNRSISADEANQVQAIIASCLNADRCAAIDAEVQKRKNASLGYTPEQIAETLKTQVNMGIGGLLLMIRQLQGTQLTEAQTAAITKRLAYWQWVVDIDAEAAACKADANRIPAYPTPPAL